MAIYLTEKQTEEARRLCTELPLIHDRLVRAGMLRTADKMHEAVREIGYELAEKASWNDPKNLDEVNP